MKDGRPVARLPVTAGRVLDAQRVAQAAVRRARALRLRVLQGLSTSDFAPARSARPTSRARSAAEAPGGGARRASPPWLGLTILDAIG